MLVVKYVEPWARTHQQRWHSEALQMFGERIVFRHRWNIQDYALGRVKRCSVCSANVRINEQQRVRVVSATGGSFTLTFAGQETDAIDWDATPEQLRDALVALEVNEEADVFVEIGGQENIATPGLVVEFRGKWAGTESVPALTYDASGLTGTSATVEVLQITVGRGGQSVKDRVAVTYKQAGNTWCTSCFGIGFEGGFEPIIYVTQALITDQEQETTINKTGVIQRANPSAQFSFEPTVQEFDLIARVYEWEADNITPKRVGGRFILREVKPVTLRTGPGSPDDSIAVIPEAYRTRYSVPNPDWTVGQEGGLEILPYEHSWNLVPLSREEERLVEMGILQNRKWYEQAGVSVPMKPEEHHPA